MARILDLDRLELCFGLAREISFWNSCLRNKSTCTRHFIDPFGIGKRIELGTAVGVIRIGLIDLGATEEYKEAIQENRNQRRFKEIKDLEGSMILAFATLYWLLQLKNNGRRRFNLYLEREA